MSGVRSAAETHPSHAQPLFPRATARREAAQLAEEPGVPLDKAAQDFFSARFEHDFSHVRVHADARAARSASSLAARAFTVGAHIGFGSGEFAPGTAKGGQLLAHELAHVVQQSRGGPPVSGAGQRALEAGANSAASQAVRGEPVTVAGQSAVEVACQSLSEESNDGVYATRLLREALENQRPTWKIVDDVNALGSTDRTRALQDLETERAFWKGRREAHLSNHPSGDATRSTALNPEAEQASRMLARIDQVLAGLALRRPIPGWNFTPGDFANLQRAKKSLTFAPDSSWFPFQANLKNILQVVLDPMRSPSATEGVNAVDFFHGHLVVPKDPKTKQATKLGQVAEAKGIQAEKAVSKAREWTFGDWFSASSYYRKKMKSPAAIAAYDRRLQRLAPSYARAMEFAAKVPGAAILYHTFETNIPSDVKARGGHREVRDPRRHWVVPLATNAPQPYAVSPKEEVRYDTYDFTHIMRFVFQIDPQGAIHVRPSDLWEMSAEISAITGLTYPPALEFDDAYEKL